MPCRMTSKLTQEEESKTIILLALKATVWQLMLSQQRKTGLKSLTETTKTLMSMATLANSCKIKSQLEAARPVREALFQTDLSRDITMLLLKRLLK